MTVKNNQTIISRRNDSPAVRPTSLLTGENTNHPCRRFLIIFLRELSRMMVSDFVGIVKEKGL